MFPVSLHGDDDFEAPEYALVESTGVGQAPDWLEDEASVSLEAQLLDLEYLCHSLVSSRGMNRQFAAEAHRVLPGFADRYPLGFFTEETTQTNYKVSLEELHVGVWAAIGAAAAAVSYMLYRFVRWILSKLTGSEDTSGSSSGKPSDAEITSDIKKAGQAAAAQAQAAPEIARALEQAAQANQKVLDDVQQALPEIKNAVIGHDGNPDGTKIKDKDGLPEPDGKAAGDKEFRAEDFDSMESYMAAVAQRHLKARYGSLIAMENHAYFDIMTNGPWTQKVLSFAPILNATEAALSQRVSAIESVFGASLLHGNRADLEKAKILLQNLSTSLPTPGTDYKDLHSFSAATHDFKSLMAQNTKHMALDPIAAQVRQVAIIRDPKYAELLNARTKAFDKLEETHQLEIRMADVSLKWNAAHPGTGQGEGVPLDISHMVARAANTIKQDINSFMQVLYAIQNFLDTLDRFQLETASMMTSFHVLQQRINKQYKIPFELPPEVTVGAKIIDTLRRKLGRPVPSMK